MQSGKPDRGGAKPKKELIKGLIQYSIEEDKLEIANTTVSIKKMTYYKVIKERRHRIIFICDLSSEDKLSQATNFVDGVYNGIKERD